MKRAKEENAQLLILALTLVFGVGVVIRLFNLESEQHDELPENYHIESALWTDDSAAVGTASVNPGPNYSEPTEWW